MINQDSVDDSTEKWLDNIESRLYYERWYCGHWHISKRVDKPTSCHDFRNCRGMIMSDQQYYRILLDDYSAASFTSFDKAYFGTMSDLEGWIKAIEVEKCFAERFSSLTKTFRAISNRGSTTSPTMLLIRRFASSIR